MASKTFLLLFIANLIITVYTQDQITSAEDIKNLEDSDEVEETTLHSEEEEEYNTTTLTPQEDENRTKKNEEITPNELKEITEEFLRKNIDDLIDKEEEINSRKTNKADEVFRGRELGNGETERDDNTNNITEPNEVTQPSVNNDVDGQTNITNNIDLAAKTDTIPMQTTTKSLDEEPIPTVQETKELESSGPRIPKADNDPERIFPQPITPPQSTRSIVRGWLDDTWIRSPVGILVPLRATALSRALAVWNDLNASTLNLSKVCFIAYDENGVRWRSKHNLHPSSYEAHEKSVTEVLSKLLLKYQGVNTDARTDGTMRALTGAAKLVPYDSALFVLTDGGAGDAYRLPLTLRAVVEKRLKVYTLWTNPNYPTVDNEDGLQALRNISKHTEGDVIPYPLQVIDIDGSSNSAAEAELEQWSPMDKSGRRGKLNPNVEVGKFDLLVVRRGGGQAISLGVPVENGVTALRIFIEGAVEHAVLYPPNEAPQIDLYNATSVSTFSPASRTEGLSPRDVYLVFPGSLDSDNFSVLSAPQSRSEPLPAFVGIWHLSVRCDTCDYRLCVSARSQIHFDVTPDVPNNLKFRVSGPVASVRESQLVDEYGTELAKLPFSYQPIASDGQKVEKDPVVELVADVALPAVKSAKVYSKIVGRDIRGEPFVRLAGPLSQSEVRTGRSAAIQFPDSTNDLERTEEYLSRQYQSQQQINGSDLPFSRVSQVVNQQGTLLTAIQIGLASRLYGSPGDNLQLHFEVTNYREQTVRFAFGATGEFRFLTGINPSSQNIAPGQTVNVIVSVRIPTNAQPGMRDTITFTAYGNEQISMAAYVYVSSPQDRTDIWAPEVRHTFQGTCLGRTGDDCAQHGWSVTIIARDGTSGLLRLSSSPVGLLYSGEFVSGTRQEVVATYRATCCTPRLLLNAVDANGNTNSLVIDISGYLTEAAIAAIVLGVFLLIALIVLLILLIYWCVKKRRESRELPSYNTRS